MDSSSSLFTQHERKFQDLRFVYPVISRRSAGVSIGVNLNPDKVCNFDCIYCQVDRTSAGDSKFVEIDRLVLELDLVLKATLDGSLFLDPKFAATPAPLRRLNDIAFSGDGEPTTYRNFDEIIDRCAAVKRANHADEVKMVLITNASMLHRDHVKRGLEILDQNQGEIWAKLDAGTQEYFQLVDRSRFTLEQIVDNISEAAKVRPLVIQTLFMRIHDEGPSQIELQAYCDQLREIVNRGGQIKLVQIYTIARQTTEAYVTRLSNAEVDGIVELVKAKTGLVVQGFYGVAAAKLDTTLSSNNSQEES